jgi:hypothetical protein
VKRYPRCEVSTSCPTQPTIILLYEESPGGHALAAFACWCHAYSTLQHCGRPVTVLDYPYIYPGRKLAGGRA